MKAQKKSIVIISAFALLIVFTAVCSFALATGSYYDDINNGEKFLTGFGAVVIAVFGAFAVVCELDLFFTVYYFSVQQKSVFKTILNILASLLLSSIILFVYLFEAHHLFRAYEMVSYLLLFVYFAVRSVYGVVTMVCWLKKHE